MGKVTKADLIEAIDDVLANKPVLKWDYYVSVENDDEIIRYWSSRMRQIGQDHSDQCNGRMLTEEGLQKVKELRDEMNA